MNASLQEVACPLCGSDDRDILYDDLRDRMAMGSDSFTVARCSCGHAYLSIRPSTESLGQYYPPAFWHIGSSTQATGLGALVSRMEQAYRRWLLREDLATLSRCVPKGGRLLDVGCGIGDIVALAGTIGIEATGLEISPDAVRYAREVRGLDVHQGMVEQCDLPAASFDAVSLFHVLEHVDEPISFLRAIRRLLKPDARVIIQVPNFASFQARLFGAGWYALDPPRHLQHFSPESLRAALMAAGFQIETEAYDSFRCNPVSFATSLMPGLEPRQGTRTGRQLPHFKAAFLMLTWLVAPITWLESKSGNGGVITVIARSGKTA